MKRNIYVLMALANLVGYLVLMVLYRYHIYLFHRHDPSFLAVFFLIAKILAGFTLLLTGLMWLVWRMIEKAFSAQGSALKKQ